MDIFSIEYTLKLNHSQYVYLSELLKAVSNPLDDAPDFYRVKNVILKHYGSVGMNHLIDVSNKLTETKATRKRKSEG